MVRLVEDKSKLDLSNTIVLPYDETPPDGWRLMRRAEVTSELSIILKVVTGLPRRSCVALHEDDFVFANFQSKRNRSKKSKSSVFNKKNRKLASKARSQWTVRVKRTLYIPDQSVFPDKIRWMLLRKKKETNISIRRSTERLNLTFSEILEYTRTQLMHAVGPHPAQITLSFINFSTGTYIEQDSYFKVEPEHSFLKCMIRSFRVFIDFQSNKYAMHETVGGLLRKTLGTFTYEDSTVRKYARTSEGFQHCVELELHQEKVTDPSFPAFQAGFRFHIMSQKIAVRWFPTYGLLISANGGHTGHFLKWEYYDCQLKDEEVTNFGDGIHDARHQRRSKYRFMKKCNTFV